jgi:hypothetical protein
LIKREEHDSNKQKLTNVNYEDQASEKKSKQASMQIKLQANVKNQTSR